MRMRNLLILIVMLPLAGALVLAQTTALKGRVMDTSGAVMPGANIKVYRGETLIKEAKAEATGDFSIPLDPGEYRIEVTAPDFETHTEIVRVTPDLTPLAVSLGLAQISQTVDVQTQQQELNLQADSNLTATVLGQDFIQQLPDDEEELRAILEQIASSGGGPGAGAEFLIDGFSGGRLPPKDQIMQIRINTNPYSTEFSRSGWGRTEIITRAGSGTWRGGMNFIFRDEALNAAPGLTNIRPPYQQRNFGTNISGPIIPGKFSLSFNGNYSESEDFDTIIANTPTQSIADVIVRSNGRRNLNARGQYQLTRNNLLNFNFGYGKSNNLNNGAGGFNLPERASDRHSRDFEMQARETAVIGSKLVSELRFSFNRDTNSQTPRTIGRAINVLDAFSGGGAQNNSESINKLWEFGNVLTYALSPKFTVKTGFQGTYRDQYSRSEDNFLGTFVFSSLDDYLAGRPVTFTMTEGDPILSTKQFEAGMFLQTDWSIHPRFSLSTGLRYEAQSNLDDYNNLDPRIGFAFRLNETLMLRGGSGVFHQRLNIGQVETLLRLDGARQRQIVVRNPSFPSPFAAGNVNVVPPSSIRVRAADLAAPYTINSSLSAEKKLPRGLTLTGTYEYVRGIHLLRNRNTNAPLPEIFVRPDPSNGNVLQLESTAHSKTHSFTVGFNQQLPRGIGFFGNYSTSSAYSDVAGGGGGFGGFGGFGGSGGGVAAQPTDNYNLALDWGRSNDYIRHRVFTGITARLPWSIYTHTMIVANSGRPYTVTTGRDDNRDTNVNDRPPDVPRNSEIGPSNWNVNLNFSKAIRLRKAESPSPGNNGANNGGAYTNSFVAPQHGPGPAPGSGGQHGPGTGGPVVVGPGGRGQGGPGGPGVRVQGGPGIGQQNRLEMQIFANIQNLFNHTNYMRISGVSTSPSFGRPTGAGRPREISVGLRFNF